MPAPTDEPGGDPAPRGALFVPERPVGDDTDLLFSKEPDDHGVAHLLRFVTTQITACARPDGDRPQEAVMAVCAPWGSGKTSILNIIRGRVRDAVGDDRKVGFAHCNVLAWDRGAYGAELGLLAEMFSALPGTAQDRVLRVVDAVTGEGFIDRVWSDRADGTDAHNPVRATYLLLSAVKPWLDSGIGSNWLYDMLTAELATLRSERSRPRQDDSSQSRSADDSGASAPSADDDSGHSPPSGNSPDAPRFVVVVFIDDLDRTPVDFAAQTLRAVNRWGQVPGVFFVMAADRVALEEAAERASQTAAEGAQAPEGESPLLKYVHSVFEMPSLLDSGRRVAGYLSGLLEQQGLPADVDSVKLLGKSLGNAKGGEATMLIGPLLRPGTPRQAKARLNEVLRQVSRLRGTNERGYKRAIGEALWPVAWRAHFQGPELRFGEDREADEAWRKWVRTALDLGRKALHVADDDLDKAAEVYGVLADAEAFDLQGCPADLLVWLVTEPAWAPTVPDDEHFDAAGAPSREEDREVPKQQATPFPLAPNDLVESLGLDTEVAEKREDAGAVRDLCRRLLRAAEQATGSNLAPTVGNAALRAWRAGDGETSWRLHRRAHDLNPDHANVALNLVDAALMMDRDEFFEEGWQLLDEVERQAPQWRPYRRRKLQLLVARRLGREVVFDAERLVEQCRGGAGTEWVDVDDLIELLAEMGEWEALEELARWAVTDQALAPQRAQLLYSYAAELVRRRPVEHADERAGADMLRSVAMAALDTGDEGRLGIALSTLSKVCAPYEWLAEGPSGDARLHLFQHAYGLGRDVRVSFARFLLQRLGEVEAAQALHLGEPLDDLDLEPPPDVRSVLEGLDFRLESERWW